MRKQHALRLLMLAIMFGPAPLHLTGCEEGAFEEAGEEVDDAVDEAEDAVD